ncbi:MAG: hypothetical protein MK132_10660 [Lentisphaerales bacterium]|nr:hypothetical protein [Lentisphaerales bacterium]
MRDYFFEGQETASVDSFHFYINEKFKSLLAKNQLHKLEDFMSLPRDNSFRDVPNRLTIGLDLSDGESTRRVYLKRHWKDAKSNNNGPHLEAKSEADNISLLHDRGIPVPELVASGWGYINNRPVGFVVMHEVPGIQGDHFIGAQLTKPEWPTIRQGLIHDLAALSSKFHNMGFNHRDLYLCHFFVDLEETSVVLNMIDLQRVQHRKLFRHRWIVKDLSQLCYSSMKLVSNTNRLKFFLKYMDMTTLDSQSKRFVRQILKKTARLIRRGEQGKDK